MEVCKKSPKSDDILGRRISGNIFGPYCRCCDTRMLAACPSYRGAVDEDETDGLRFLVYYIIGIVCISIVVKKDGRGSAILANSEVDS